MAVEKDEAEHALRRYRDDGQLMVDNERRRLEREMQFKKGHEECVAQYEATMKSQVTVHPPLASLMFPAMHARCEMCEGSRVGVPCPAGLDLARSSWQLEGVS